MGRTRHLLWLTGFILAILGFDSYCLNLFAAQTASKNYLTITGSVSRCRMQNVGAATNHAVVPRQRFEFEYNYFLHGQKFSSHTYRYLENISPELAFAKFPEGSAIPIYYDSRRPSDSVLERGLTDADFGKMGQLFCINTMCISLLALWSRWLNRLVFRTEKIWQS